MKSTQKKQWTPEELFDVLADAVERDDIKAARRAFSSFEHLRHVVTTYDHTKALLDRMNQLVEQNIEMEMVTRGKKYASEAIKEIIDKALAKDQLDDALGHRAAYDTAFEQLWHEGAFGEGEVGVHFASVADILVRAYLSESYDRIWDLAQKRRVS
jgi:hypothetical protein